ATSSRSNGFTAGGVFGSFLAGSGTGVTSTGRGVGFLSSTVGMTGGGTAVSAGGVEGGSGGGLPPSVGFSGSGVGFASARRVRPPARQAGSASAASPPMPRPSTPTINFQRVSRIVTHSGMGGRRHRRRFPERAYTPRLPPRLRQPVFGISK